MIQPNLVELKNFNRIWLCFWVAFGLLAWASPAAGQVKIVEEALTCGGGTMESASYKVYYTLGQVVVDSCGGDSVWVEQGFWQMPTPVVQTGISGPPLSEWLPRWLLDYLSRWAWRA